jgi:hypothetical protein
VRERWLGSSGRKVPEIAIEGQVDLPPETLVLDGIEDIAALRSAFDEGRPVAVRAQSADSVKAALARPEVSCVLVSSDRAELLELDLRTLTYG